MFKRSSKHNQKMKINSTDWYSRNKYFVEFFNFMIERKFLKKSNLLKIEIIYKTKI